MEDQGSQLYEKAEQHQLLQEEKNQRKFKPNLLNSLTEWLFQCYQQAEREKLQDKYFPKAEATGLQGSHAGCSTALMFKQHSINTAPRAAPERLRPLLLEGKSHCSVIRASSSQT